LTIFPELKTYKQEYTNVHDISEELAEIPTLTLSAANVTELTFTARALPNIQNLTVFFNRHDYITYPGYIERLDNLRTLKIENPPCNLAISDLRLEEMRYLESFTWFNTRPQLPNKVHYLISRKLTYLHIQNECGFTIDKRSFVKCPKIERLRLIGIDNLNSALKAVERLSELRHLALGSLTQFKKIELWRLNACKELTSLTLEVNGSGKIDLTKLNGHPTLRRVNIKCSGILTTVEVSKYAEGNTFAYFQEYV
jgi:hypothetical protein